MQEIRKNLISALQPSTKSAKKKDQKIKRAKYMKEEYRPSKERIDCTLTKEEFRHIKAEAKAHGKNRTAFFRESALAYTKQKYLVPANIREKLEENIFLLKNIANNLNQIAKHANSKHKI